jgi:hypothetical protein
MAKVDDVNDFRTLSHSQPGKEDPFLKAFTQLSKTLGCHGKVEGAPVSAKKSLSTNDVEKLVVLNEALHALVMAHTPEHKHTKKPKTSKN